MFWISDDFGLGRPEQANIANNVPHLPTRALFYTKVLVSYSSQFENGNANMFG